MYRCRRFKLWLVRNALTIFLCSLPKLPLKPIDGAVAYMLRRAQRELQVVRGSFGKEHKKIIKAFLADHNLNRRQKFLFKHIPQYLKAGSGAVLFEARREKKLVAFIIVD